MTDTKWKPCPFCGEGGFLCWGPDKKYEFIFCENCYAQGPCELTGEDAEYLWNNRAREANHGDT
ncbi:Lar family restriction alleviation protein [Bombella sp. ESL0385]|uniref:Lar family restriction alleviation protein n=1 Tax=Bombella sp. ESL0385 TaxID=2676446 RepID=UPI0012D86BEF|nr:restriction alleviation protein, Lar family [Bombella sp. ESL0385]